VADISDTAVESLIAAQTAEVYIVLVTIDHPEFAAPIRATSDAQDTVSDGETFVPYAFDLRLHPDGPDEIGRARIRITNVGLEIMGGVRSVQGGELLVTASVVLGSDPDAHEIGPLEFEAETVPWDALWVDCVLGGDSWLNDAWPYTQFTPGTTPGLWL